MIMDKQAKLVRRLYDRTERGEIEWKVAPRGDSFQVSFPSYSVIISDIERRNSRDIRIEIVNGSGEVADVFTDVDLQGTPGVPEPHEDWYPAMEHLMGRARRTALGADKALDEILRDLG